MKGKLTDHEIFVATDRRFAREWQPSVYGTLKDPHERECASAAIAARLEKAKTPAEKREWRKFRRDMLGR